MKKINTLLALSITFLSACQKGNDYLKQESLKTSQGQLAYLQHKPNAEIKTCEIRQIYYTIGGVNDFLQFTYNSLGDPVTITRSLGASTGHPNFVFKYDEKNRLTDFIGTYTNNIAAEFWHKYFYDNRGNIILDSTYIFPKIINGFPENAYSSQLTFYTYDKKSRIIKDSTVFSKTNYVTVHSYSYDENGNKDGNVYDDKYNINRTNLIWMFLNRDYSVNNPTRAVNYNEAGLPLNFNLSESDFFEFLGNYYSNVQISYQCSKN